MFDYRIFCIFLFIFIGGIYGTLINKDESGSSVELISKPTYETFRDMCSIRIGEFRENVKITSVMIMAANTEKKLFIAINNEEKYIAWKNATDLPSDTALVDSAIRANLLKNTVDLCIGEDSDVGVLKGINLK